MKIKELEEKLKFFLNKEDCYNHSLRVKETAAALARHYGIDVNKTEISALLHDCARKYTEGELIMMAEDFNIPITELTLAQPHNLLHSHIGSIIARNEFNITDPEIISAIKNHTMGANEMSALSKIIFLSDKIEPERKFNDIEKLRLFVYKDLDKATLMAFDIIIAGLLETKQFICEQTINSRNKILFYIQQNSKKEKL